jgi:hypothetical protein
MTGLCHSLCHGPASGPEGAALQQTHVRYIVADQFAAELEFIRQRETHHDLYCVKTKSTKSARWKQEKQKSTTATTVTTVDLGRGTREGRKREKEQVRNQ